MHIKNIPNVISQTDDSIGQYRPWITLLESIMYLHYAPLRLTILAAALSLALPAHAQQALPIAPAAGDKTAASDDKTIQKVEVKGAASSYDARRDDTASKIVMNHDEIIKYGDTNVLDVLKRLPGVTVSGASGRGGEIRMRGLGSGYTQILVNGERAPAGFSMDSLAPDSIERIEVIRAATAEYSTQSIAGTINIVLKKAITKAQRELKLGMGAGKGIITPNYNVQMSDRKGQLSYSLTVNGFHNRFDRDTPGADEAYDLTGKPVMYSESIFHEKGGYDGVNIGPRLNWTFENGDTLTSQSFVNLGRFKRDAQSDEYTSIGAPPLVPSLNWKVTNENYFFRSDLNWVKKLDAGAKLDLKIGGVIGALRNDSWREGYLVRGGRQALDSYVKTRGTDKGYSSTGKYSTPLFEGHALSVGWDGGYTKRDDSRRQREAEMFAVGDPLYAYYRPMNANGDYTGEVTRLAAYAQDEWNVTPRWSVYVGVRWEGINTAVSGSDFADSTSHSSVWSPLFQTLYKLPDTKGDQVRFAITRTYKAPSVQQLIPRRFTSTNNSPTEPDYQGNPELKPELALGFDASYEHYWGEGALVSVSASMRKIDGYTRQGIVLAADGRWIQLPVNDGTATTRTLEFEAKFPLKSVIKNAPAIDLRANFARNWSTVDAVEGPNNRLDQQNPFSSTLGMDYKLGQLTTGASYSFRTGGPVRVSDRQGVFQSARRDIELYSLWKFDPKNQLRVGLYNVLAQQFVTENTYRDPKTGTLKSRSIAPGVVTLRAVMEMKF